jgi:hypothetical protein
MNRPFSGTQIDDSSVSHPPTVHWTPPRKGHDCSLRVGRPIRARTRIPIDLLPILATTLLLRDAGVVGELASVDLAFHLFLLGVVRIWALASIARLEGHDCSLVLLVGARSRRQQERAPQAERLVLLPRRWPWHAASPLSECAIAGPVLLVSALPTRLARQATAAVQPVPADSPAVVAPEPVESGSEGSSNSFARTHSLRAACSRPCFVRPIAASMTELHSLPLEEWDITPFVVRDLSNGPLVFPRRPQRQLQHPDLGRTHFHSVRQGHDCSLHVSPFARRPFGRRHIAVVAGTSNRLRFDRNFAPRNNECYRTAHQSASL